MVVDVWIRALEGDTPTDAEYTLLDEGEQARAEGISAPSVLRSYVGSHALLRRLLADRLGIDPAVIRYERSCEHCGHPSHGRPRLVDGGVDFSLSHSGRWVLVAVGPGPLGGDIEDGGRRPVEERVVARSAGPGDLEAMAGLAGDDRQRAFLGLWTAKEAVAKALGLGLVLPFRSFSVVGPGPVVAREGAPPLVITRIPVPGPELAVAAVAASPDVPVELR